MEIFKLFGTILIKDDKALSTLKSVDKNANSASKSMSKAFKAIGTAVLTYFTVSKIKEFGKACLDAWEVQQAAELKLETVMKQRMNSTDKSIQSIKDLTSAQQSLGVVGDEVQLSGAQQLATFLDNDKALKTLIPSMNDLAVQQKGVNVSTGDMVNIGNLFGKVMQGQTGALKKMGITFTESQEQVLKFGTEEERAAMLAEVITANVGNMNAEFAKTDAGKIQQAKNNFGDLQEMIGKYLQPVIAAFYDKMNDVTVWLMDNLPGAIDTCSKAIQTMKDKWSEFKDKLKEGKTWIDNNKTALQALAVMFTTLGVAILAYNSSAIIAAVSSTAETVAIYGLIAAETIATGATTILTGATAALSAVIGFLTSPITIAIAAIGLLVAAGVLLYKNWDQVKASCAEFKQNLINNFNAMKEGAINKFNEMKTGVVNKFNEVKSNAINIWNAISTSIGNVVNGIKTAVITAWNFISSVTSSIFNTVKSIAISVWNGIKSSITSVVNGIKSTVSSVWNGISSVTSSVFNTIKSVATSVWNGIKTAITTPIESAKNTVKGIVDQIKGFFSNMKLSLPKITIPSLPKLPSVKITGSFSLSPPSVPRISWNAKGGIFSKPTIFGTSAGLQGVGEAGAEAILPLAGFYNHLDKKLDGANSRIDYSKMTQAFIIALRELQFNVDGKNLFEAMSPHMGRASRGW